MILQSLASHYDALVARGEIARPGWSKAKISYALNLASNGELIGIFPLKTLEQRGKKEEMVPRMMELPAPVKRTVNVAANFLWDNSNYLLGTVDGDEKKAKQRFQAAKDMHCLRLKDIDCNFAKAVVAFFDGWDSDAAEENPLFTDIMDDLKKGANLTFMYDGEFAGDNKEMANAWQEAYDGAEAGEKMRCLVTGQSVVPEKTHPSIKGVSGAQSSGAALVSFNADAYQSYNKEQNINAPVGKAAAFAYTAALNHLLSVRDINGKPRASKRIGDMTVVYWAENAEPAYQSAFAALLDGQDDTVTDRDLNAIMDAVSQNRAVDWDGVPLNPKNKFYILGLSPNAARLSVRFFLQDSFGRIVKNIQKHYERLEIIKPDFDKFETIPLWKLLGETINQNARDKAPSPQMAGDTMRALLTGGMYPATLYQQVQLRIRADRTISRGRAAIIKAYLIRNTNNEKYKEALTVELNENTTYQPYLLGRLFSVLEKIQERANPGINATIKDKYFTAACSTPSSVFPVLMNLSQKHLRKIDGYYFEKQLGDLMALITESYPVHHTLYDQGIFQLGYYHQTQKHFEKKEKTNKVEEGK